MSLITQSGSYMPDTDSGIRDWLNNFAQIVSIDPAAVALSSSDAATLTSLAAAYDAAYVLAVNPVTRTTPIVGNKDAARNQAVETFRVYATQVKGNLGVSDEMKLALGLHLNDTTRSPIPAPTTEPLLAIIDARSGVHTLRYADSTTPTSRSKPAGTIQLQLWVAIEVEPTADVTKAQFHGVYTKQPIQIAFDPANAGKTASYFARWITRTGLVGPWSLPVAMIVAFGGPVELQSAA